MTRVECISINVQICWLKYEAFSNPIHAPTVHLLSREYVINGFLCMRSQKDQHRRLQQFKTFLNNLNMKCRVPWNNFFRELQAGSMMMQDREFVGENPSNRWKDFSEGLSIRVAFHVDSRQNIFIFNAKSVIHFYRKGWQDRPYDRPEHKRMEELDLLYHGRKDNTVSIMILRQTQFSW